MGENRGKWKIMKEMSLPVYCLRGAVKKKNSIFKDIVQIGGGEVNPMSKI